MSKSCFAAQRHFRADWRASLASADEACAEVRRGSRFPVPRSLSRRRVAAGTFCRAARPLSQEAVTLSAFYKMFPLFAALCGGETDCRLRHQARSLAAAAGWNGKLQGIGNGGFAGLSISATWRGREQGIRATATDTGHTGRRSMRPGRWGIRKGVDFGHRGIPRNDAGREGCRACSTERTRSIRTSRDVRTAGARR